MKIYASVFLMVTAITVAGAQQNGRSDSAMKVDYLCPDPVDVAVLLDESSSIQPYEIDEEKKFAKNLISQFAINRFAAQFSVMTFAASPRIIFNLKTSEKKEELYQYIDWITQRGGKTNTHNAIQLLRTYTFKAAQGGRSAAKPVALIVTDGQSQLTDKTRIESAKVRDTGVTMIAIGVGDQVRQTELKDITGDDRFIFRVDKYADLNDIIREISKSICSVCMEKKADLFVLLDDELNASKDDFLQKYLYDFFKSFNVSQDQTRIGIITYGTKVDVLSELTQSDSSAALEQVLARLTSDTKTYPGAAMAAMKKANDRFMKDGRKDVAKAVVILTSGPGFGNDAKNVADELRKSGTEIFLSAIAHKPDMETLVNITGNAGHVFAAHSAYRLKTTRANIVASICEIEVEQKESPYECRGKAADVVFIMDESSSITWPDYDKEKQFLIDVIAKFNVGLNFTRVGLVTFSDEAKLRFDLDDYVSIEPLNLEITVMPRYPGNTNTSDALKMARNQIFPARFGSRKGLQVDGVDIPQIGVVITDGRSQNTLATAREATALHDDGITLIVVAIGEETDPQELENIASNPGYILPVADFNALHSVVDRLSAKVCKAARDHVTVKPTVPAELPVTKPNIYRGPERGDIPIGME